MPRPSNTDRRRDQIVDGLRAALARHGYAGATIPRIAKEAGLAPGLIHYHFADKEEILLALAERLRAVFRARYERRRPSKSDPTSDLRAHLDAHVALGPDADPTTMACWVQLGAEGRHHRAVARVVRRALSDDLRRIEILLRKRLQTEGRSTRRIGVMAASLLCAIEGAYRIGTSAPGLIPRGSASAMIRSALDDLVLACPITRRSHG